MAQTGMQRSLTVIVEKTIAGVMQDSYPITYQGRNSFTVNDINWPSITLSTLVSMTLEAYNARLAAFKSYVESREVGLHFSTDIVEGYEPYKENLTSCTIQTL